MQVIAWSQNLTEARAAECGARRVEKEDLFRASDIVTVHLVLSERTRGIVGAREIGLMKRSAYLVNTARGPIVTRRRWSMRCAAAPSPERRSTSMARSRCRPAIRCAGSTTRC